MTARRLGGFDEITKRLSNYREPLLAWRWREMNELGACAGGESMAFEQRIKEHRITIILTHEDFRQSMGRKAKSQQEFDEWAELAEKALLNTHIDWDIIYRCAEEAIQKEHGRGSENA